MRDVTGRERLAEPPIPGLDQNAPFYSRLSARSALYDQLRLLLATDQHAASAEAYRHRVLDENVLSLKSTAARKKVWQELRARYILDISHPLFEAFWEEWSHAKSEEERGLTAYVLLALHDRLVFALGVDVLYPLLRRAPQQLRVEHIQQYLERSTDRHPEVKRWSKSTALAVARKYTASIRDFGLARGTVAKKTIRPSVHSAPVRLLIRALLLTGRSTAELLQASEFRLLGISESEVISVLEELNARGNIRFRVQADIIELDLEESFVHAADVR